MDWRQQHKTNLEQRLLKIVKLIGECEDNLICEQDPQSAEKLRNQIATLKKQKNECESDLESHKQEKVSRTELAITMASVTFEDLNFVIAALLKQQICVVNTQDNFCPTYPQEKMSKNGLTNDVKFLLETGLAKAHEVRHLIENIVKINFPDVPDKLKAALSAEYFKLVDEGIQGDELFRRMNQFSSCHSSDLRWQVAGLAILCYFFEACDVFES